MMIYIYGIIMNFLGFILGLIIAVYMIRKEGIISKRFNETDIDFIQRIKKEYQL